MAKMARSRSPGRLDINHTGGVVATENLSGVVPVDHRNVTTPTTVMQMVLPYLMSHETAIRTLIRFTAWYASIVIVCAPIREQFNALCRSLVGYVRSLQTPEVPQDEEGSEDEEAWSFPWSLVISTIVCGISVFVMTVSDQVIKKCRAVAIEVKKNENVTLSEESEWLTLFEESEWLCEPAKVLITNKVHLIIHVWGSMCVIFYVFHHSYVFLARQRL